MIPYTLTNDSLTLIIDGKPRVFQTGSIPYNTIVPLIVAGQWDEIPQHLTVTSALDAYLARSGCFKINADGKICYSGEPIDSDMERRIRDMAAKGEDFEPIMNFYLRLANNPSWRSTTQLWPFLAKIGTPIEPEGTFLAYKGVTTELKDCHTETFNNSPGVVHSMPRNRISDDPNKACHVGFHVGSLNYASNFGARVMIVRVDPADVVCVPYDHHSEKMRVSTYEVVGFHVEDGSSAMPMPSTTYEVDTFEPEVDTFEPEVDTCEPEVDTFEPEVESEESEAHSATPIIEAIKRGEATKPKSKIPNLSKVDAKGLFEQTLADLRTYASKKLKIVGASKLPGGKTSLVRRILQVRGK